MKMVPKITISKETAKLPSAKVKNVQTDIQNIADLEKHAGFSLGVVTVTVKIIKVNVNESFHTYE